jgi:hypothetical protein
MKQARRAPGSDGSDGRARLTASKGGLFEKELAASYLDEAAIGG